MRALAAGLWLLSATAATACDVPVFSCDVGAKRLSICLTGETLTYSFGPSGAPELLIDTDLSRLDYIPWAGVGRHLFESVRLRNGDYTYEVWHSLDRLDPDATLEGGVIVFQGDDTLADLSCTPRTARGDLYTLFVAIEATGRCFDLNTRTWGACNGG